MAEKKTPFTLPSLVGDKHFLRVATAEDIANTHHWFMQSEPQSLFCTPIPILTAAEAAEAFKKEPRGSDRQEFMVVRSADNSPVGRIQYFNFNAFNQSVELFVLVDPEERKKGHAKAAIRLLCHHLFSVRGVNRISMQVSALNAAGIALMDSCDFHRDGLIRHQFLINREYYDGYLYSLLKFETSW